jgi:hypothetical protein
MVHVGGVVVCVSYGIDFAIGLVLPSRVNKLEEHDHPSSY